RKEGVSISGPKDWCVSNDGKTAAMWNGQGFDLIDTTTGEARGKTASLELQGDETEFHAMKAVFSPNGTRILANVRTVKKRGGGAFAVCFPMAGKEDALRLKTNGYSNSFWWGDKHVFNHGHKDWGFAGTVFDATTGKEVANVKHAGSIVTDNPDGKWRCIVDGGKDAKALVLAAFPKNLLPELE